MPSICLDCGVAGINCVCVIIEKAKRESDMNCNENNRVYPHKGMTPVEISDPTDSKWRQMRDKGNKHWAVRKAIVDMDNLIKERTKEIEAEMVEVMTLGELHPNTHSCMGDD